MAFYHLEPWGFEIDNLQTGVVAATMANTARDPKRRKKPYTAEEFTVKVEEPVVAPLGEQALKAKIDAAMVALGGRRRKEG